MNFFNNNSRASYMAGLMNSFFERFPDEPYKFTQIGLEIYTEHKGKYLELLLDEFCKMNKFNFNFDKQTCTYYFYKL